MSDGQAINVSQFIDAIRARQLALGLTSAELERRMNLSDGHVDKILGPSRTKGFGLVILDRLMKQLAFTVVLVPNAEREARLGEYKRSRGSWDNHRISKVAVERAKPVVLSQFAMAGVEARKRELTGELRTKIARKAGKASGRARRRLRQKLYEASKGMGA